MTTKSLLMYPPGLAASSAVVFLLANCRRKRAWAASLVLAFGTLLVAPQARASIDAYGVDLFNDLYYFDLAAPNPTLIGNISTVGGGQMQSLAIDASGQLYGGDSLGRVYQLNKNNASVQSSFGTVIAGGITGMDFNGNQLMAVNGAATPTKYAIDLFNQNAITITTLGVTSPARSIAVVGNTALTMHGTAFNQNDLYLSAVNGGVANLLGSVPPAQRLTAIDTDANGTLYGLMYTGKILVIPANQPGNAVLIFNNGAQDWEGLAIAVPEPASLILLGAGLVALWIVKRKRS